MNTTSQNVVYDIIYDNQTVLTFDLHKLYKNMQWRNVHIVINLIDRYGRFNGISTIEKYNIQHDKGIHSNGTNMRCNRVYRIELHKVRTDQVLKLNCCNMS